MSAIQAENEFTKIIRTIRAIEKKHASGRKSKFQLYGEKIWITSMFTVFVPFVVLYIWHSLFPINLKTVEAIIIISVGLAVLLMFLFFVFAVLDIVFAICSKQLSWDTLINRARIQYPVVNEVQSTLPKVVDENTLSSFAQWTEYRIKNETKFAILVGALIAALPTFKAFGTQFMVDQLFYRVVRNIQTISIGSERSTQVMDSEIDPSFML